MRRGSVEPHRRSVHRINFTQRTVDELRILETARLHERNSPSKHYPDVVAVECGRDPREGPGRVRGSVGGVSSSGSEDFAKTMIRL